MEPADHKKLFLYFTRALYIVNNTIKPIVQCQKYAGLFAFNTLNFAINTKFTAATLQFCEKKTHEKKKKIQSITAGRNPKWKRR